MKILLVLLPLLLGANCGPGRALAPEPEPETVRVVRVKEEEYRPAVETFGSLVFSSKADIYPAVEGRVEALFAEEGDRVEKGALLALLSKEELLLSRDRAGSAVESKRAEHRLADAKLLEGRRTVEARLLLAAKAEADVRQKAAEFKAVAGSFANKKRLFLVGGIAEGDLAAAETQYVTSGIAVERAEKELELQSLGFRDEDIREAGFLPPSSGEERRALVIALNTRTLEAERSVAEAELEAALTELRRVDLLLSETEVRSPLAGVVGRRGLELGEKAGPDTLLFSVFAVDTLYALAEAAERDLPAVGIGMEAEVRADGFPPLRGRVKLVSPYLNPSTKSAELRIEVRNPSGNLLPGMFVRVKIFTGAPRRRLRIPESALLGGEENGFSVLRLRDSRLFRTPVEVADWSGGAVTAVRGLAAGEFIAEKPSRAFREGLRVEAVE